MGQKLVGAFAVLVAFLAWPTYLVISHWGWMNDAQHSSAIQTATAMILGFPTLIFAVFASVAALQSAEVSQAQARAADAQAESAQSQTRVSELQLEISRITLKEQTRPILNLRRVEPNRPWHDWGQLYEIANTGSGTAHKLEVAAIRGDRSSPWGTDRTMMDFIISPGQTSPILIRGGGYTYLRFFYESLAGHRYISTFAFTPRDEMVCIYVENTGTQGPIEGDIFNANAMSEWQIAERDSGADSLQ